MKVLVINKTNLIQFVDIAGLGNANDIIPVSPKSKVVLEIANEKQFINLAKKFRDKLILRKF